MKPARHWHNGMTIKFQKIKTNGIRLHTALAGPEEGEPVFLLHGFPDAWFGWEAQIGPLVDAGFRVIVPDQRGYNLSDKPEGVASYQMDTLVKDILGLAEALGYESFYLAGHDFGAMVAWSLALCCPERIKRLVIANVPHPQVMSSYLRTHIKQMLKSWYALFFQIPGLPEWVVKLNNWRFLISAMPDNLSEEERNRYRETWNQPAAMTSMMNWYRAFFRVKGQTTQSSQIQVPTLILWGKQDPHLCYEMAALSLELCDDGQLITFEDATHWILHDEPEVISKYIVEYFSESK
jgi:pimeloyl-ACP methyl ester carboxylesterase